nr:MAG TPA: hypothetical protein [Caudoviricetes sp.]
MSRVKTDFISMSIWPCRITTFFPTILWSCRYRSAP